MKNKQIEALNSCGQSIWYDNCSRDVLNSGKLKELIDQGVSGLTSNPSIFKKAIADSSDYDSDVQRMAEGGAGVEEICESLMMSDVGAAADLLLPIYKQTGGADGFASIEVSPLLAADTDGTIQAAKRLWATLDRPNVMIKIPATPEGLPAIREVLAAGINVNVTLIFSVATYMEVFDAFISAMEKRKAQGEGGLNVASVASLFVSRVDSICEKALVELVESGKLAADQQAKFIGKVGIANSRVAYQHFSKVLKSERFQKLLKEGVRPQRPLWASTGTKNPQFSPVLYVEELVGQHTVNTLPPATLEALIQQAGVSDKLADIDESESKLLDDLKEVGVDLDSLLVRLRSDGVQAFVDAYNQLLEAIDAKRQRLAV